MGDQPDLARRLGTASAQPASTYPSAGGTYLFGRGVPGPGLGLAGRAVALRRREGS